MPADGTDDDLPANTFNRDDFPLPMENHNDGNDEDDNGCKNKELNLPEGPMMAHTFPGGIDPQQSFSICFLPDSDNVNIFKVC